MSDRPQPAPPADAYIGLGANLGDAAANLRSAEAALARLPTTRIAARSSLWRTAPIDSFGPDYLNAVLRLETGLTAPALLEALQRIELQHGRERSYRNAPRTLDLDLLLYGQQSMDSARLTLPHPRLHERAFVLAPLAEIAPALEIPGHGRIAELLAGLGAQRVERVGDRGQAARAEGWLT